jgi:thymidylate kinase
MMKFEIDGNDGTGKSFRAAMLKRIFPNIPIQDRGLFSEATLDERIFEHDADAIAQFRNSILKNNDVIYIVCVCSIRKSQERILARGGSLEEEFHTEADLKKYNERFDFLLDLVKDLPNVIRLNTDVDI